MPSPLLALLVLMATPDDGDLLSATRFDAGLRQAGAPASWSAGGRLAGPVAVLPGGEVAALVRGPAGLALVRWSPGGAVLGRHPVALAGQVRSARATGDGRLVVATDAEVVRLGPAGQVLARKALGVAPGEAPVAAAPEGAWIALPERLVFAGFAGGAAIPLPLAPARPGAEPPSREPLDPLWATEESACLLAERRRTRHPVSGRPKAPDVSEVLVLSLVSPQGELLAQRELGDVRTRWEWFWSESSSQDLLPHAAGIARRRYGGAVSLAGMGSRTGGDLVLLLAGSDGDRLVRLDGKLAERWSRPWGHDLPATVSPAWTDGLLVHAGAGLAFALDEGGREERGLGLRLVPGEGPEQTRGFALGQASDGGWLVVRY